MTPPFESPLITRLVIIRHGNTFGPEDTPTRVGARTDLPLVESGIQQAEKLGQHLKAKGLLPHALVSGPLKRTQQTAAIAAREAGVEMPIEVQEFLREIDYGIDENQVESQVLARLGAEALRQWDEHALVPQGWQVDVDALKKGWQKLGEQAAHQHKGRVVWVVTSNGIARFAPLLTGSFEDFKKQYEMKLKTGAYGVLECHEGENHWRCSGWNIRP